MPIFNGYGPLSFAVSPGDTITLFNAATDTLIAPATSRVMAPVDAGGLKRSGIGFVINFAAAPTAVVELYGGNTPPASDGPQNGVLLYTSTNTEADNYTDNSSFAFYWAELVSQSAGGALAIVAHVR